MKPDQIIVLQTLQDAEYFLASTEGRKGRSLAKFLNLKGRDSVILAGNILSYAENLICFYTATDQATERIHGHCCSLCLALIGRCRARFQVALMINCSQFPR